MYTAVRRGPQHEALLARLGIEVAPFSPDSYAVQQFPALLDRRAEAEKSSACPPGRPTTIKFALAELEKQLKRT